MHFVMNGARLRREVVTLCMSASIRSLRRERPCCGALAGHIEMKKIDKKNRKQKD
jgi:hypothetical protein